MKKLFTLLTLLVAIVTGAWAQDTFVPLRTVDFTAMTPVSFTTSGANHVTDAGYADIIFYVKSGKTLSLNQTISGNNNCTGVGVCFGGQNIAKDHVVVIPLTGVNGKLRVTLKHRYNSAKASFKIGYIDNSTEYSDTGFNTNQQNPKDANNADTENSYTYTETVCAHSNGMLYIGEAGSGYQEIEQVVIETLASSGPVDPEFTVSPTSIEVGSTATISGPTGLNFTATVKSSDPEGAVTVSDGTITGVSAGTAVVTVSSEATTDYNAYSNNFTITVTAPVTKYAVSYAAGEGSGTMNGAEYAEGASFNLPASTFTVPEGKAFNGWLCSVDNQVYAAGTPYVMTATATTFTAQYGRVANKIIYSLVDGIGSAEVTASDATVNAGTSLVLTNTNGRIKLTAATGETFQNGDAISFGGTIGNTSKKYGVKYGPTSSLGKDLNVAGTTDPLEVSGTLNLSSATSDLYIGRSDGTTTTLTSLVITRQLAVLSEGFNGVKVNGTVATENTDYTISGTTITLTNSYTAAPTVTLINTITFADNSTSDTPVNVEMARVGDNFTGTATINDVTYTVIAPANNAAELSASEEALTVTSVKVGVGTATFTLTGNNLTGEAVTLAFASAIEGLSVSPASIEISEGTVNQEVTVSYTSAEDVEQASVNLNITTDGVDAISIPVTYSSTAGVTTLADVTDATTWDWSATGLSADATSPNSNGVVVLSNVDGWASTFKAAALEGQAQYFYYKQYSCYQGSSLKFHTTIPGVVTVEYSNTGSRADEPGNYRYLYINGVKADETGTISASTHNTVSNYAVAAGDIELTGIQGENTPNMLRIYKVVFTPTVSVTISAAGAASFSSTKALDFSAVEGITAYKATAKSDSYVHLDEVAQVPAGAGVIIKTSEELTEDKTYQVPVATGDVAELDGNLMVGTVNGTFTVEAADYNKVYKYVKTKAGVVGFQKAKEGWTCQAGHAYLMLPTTSAREYLNIFGEEPIDDVATGIEAIDNSQLTIDNDAPVYNLAGQKVGKGYKGIVIINGKKVVK